MNRADSSSTNTTFGFNTAAGADATTVGLQQMDTGGAVFNSSGTFLSVNNIIGFNYTRGKRLYEHHGCPHKRQGITAVELRPLTTRAI